MIAEAQDGGHGRCRGIAPDSSRARCVVLGGRPKSRSRLTIVLAGRSVEDFLGNLADQLRDDMKCSRHDAGGNWV